MTDDKPITRQAIAAKERSGKLTVSGKLKVALDHMLFAAASRPESAKLAGMTDHSLRTALRKPHVRAYYNAGLEVLRTSERARNIAAMARVRDTSDNGVAVVTAAKALEQLAEPNGPGGIGGGRGGARAGYVIRLDDDEPAGVVIMITPRPERPQTPGVTIDVTPNEDGTE
jgi:hypothetical protein